MGFFFQSLQANPGKNYGRICVRHVRAQLCLYGNGQNLQYDKGGFGTCAGKGGLTVDNLTTNAIPL
jgi:hypothetical protein